MNIPSKYVEFNGTYDNLVANVANKVINQSPTFFFLCTLGQNGMLQNIQTGFTHNNYLTYTCFLVGPNFWKT